MGNIATLTKGYLEYLSPCADNFGENIFSQMAKFRPIWSLCFRRKKRCLARACCQKQVKKDFFSSSGGATRHMMRSGVKIVRFAGKN
jgi:hypothetical protein